MIRVSELRLPLDHSQADFLAALAQRLRVPPGAVLRHAVARRAIDARRKAAIGLIYTVDAALADESAALRGPAADPHVAPAPDTAYRLPTRPARGADLRPIVIGAGPCGLMAALILAQMGLRPIILDRGKAVRERTKDTWRFWRRGVLHPESNVQFGEGGAGTFSDGKLYSGIKDSAHRARKVLEEFVRAGAPDEILTIAKPHIGTFRLVTVVENLRRSIEALGGEYRFESHVTDLLLHVRPDGQRHARGVALADGQMLRADHVVLAIGHSARDTFAMLHRRGVRIEAKPFSIGVRIEHPQSMIDRHRFGESAGHPLLGAADYKLVHHGAGDRSVYSFCMCPGGQVVAAASEPGRLVTNGMSQYSRAERNANAGIVVGITPADYPGDPLAGIALQRRWEERAFAAGGSGYRAPAQLVGDFLAGRASTALEAVLPSYQPGVTPADLAACLPEYTVAAIREALPAFARQIPGFAMHEAVLTGVETRTSSPIRIPRGASFESVNTAGLYPAGEGAGYAGGILSAGVDGIRVAEAVARENVGARQAA